MKENRSPRLIHNWVSAVGAVIAAVAGLVILFFLILGIIAKKINPCLGIILYMVLPAFLVTGMFLVPACMYMDGAGERERGSLPIAHGLT